mgnify:CR=1 FL=1|jgi:predicted transcriptional regulator
MAKRAKLEIMKDILEIVRNNRNGIKPTPLLRRSNLSSTRFKKYYNDLLKKEFIKEVINKKSKHIFLTDNGQKFLGKYQAIINFIEEFEL